MSNAPFTIKYHPKSKSLSISGATPSVQTAHIPSERMAAFFTAIEVVRQKWTGEASEEVKF